MYPNKWYTNTYHAKCPSDWAEQVLGATFIRWHADHITKNIKRSEKTKMTNKNRKEYANALSKLGKWNYTTYFRGQWKITHEYAEKLAMRLMKSRVIKKVFFIIEKDFDPKNNHIHFLTFFSEIYFEQDNKWCLYFKNYCRRHSYNFSSLPVKEKNNTRKRREKALKMLCFIMLIINNYLNIR